MDLDEARIELAQKLGMDLGVAPEHGSSIDQVARLTDGIGADGVIITAATPSHEVISSAFKICRKKGRVVLVGDVGLSLNRSDFYEKELDFFISTSYGPGRYDNRYEEKGLDYPIAYVRWTENRNMQAYLQLIAEKRLNIAPLISTIYPLEQAPAAYSSLKDDARKNLIVLLKYPGNEPDFKEKIINPRSLKAANNQIRLGIIGPGGFAKGMHLPNLKALPKDYHLQAVVSRTGHNAVAIANQFNANYSTTSYEEVLQDPNVDAVLICTRHHLHAAMALQALRAGKHVLVEKPLALTQDELDAMIHFYQKGPNDNKPLLITGFNRRFSPYMKRIKEIIAQCTGSMIINYRMNAGYIPLDHWAHGAEGGGRNLGEACHIYDLFTFLTDSQVLSVQTSVIEPKTNYYSATDNFMVTLTFADGSIANLTYTALGSKEHPKEQMEIFLDGKVIAFNDYRSLQIIGSKTKGMTTKTREKGQLEELVAFAKCIREGGEWPIPLWQQVQATEISFQVEAVLRHKNSLNV